MIRIRALGTAEVRVGRARIRPNSVVLFGLMLYLGLSAGEAVPRERLLDVLWSEGDPGSRRHALRQLLYRLRRAGLKLVRDEEELLLSTEAVDADIVRVLAPDWPDRADRAAILAASDVLPGYSPSLPEPYREWLDALRARVGAQYRRAVLRQIAQARAEGRWADLEGWALRCLAMDPLNDEATLALAEATMMCGSKYRALDILSEYIDELGDRAKVIGLPAKMLRKRISDYRPAKTSSTAIGWQFVGREREMVELTRLLNEARDSHGCAAVLVGRPGIGKTRLATEFAAASELQGIATVTTRLQTKDARRPMALFTDLVPQLLAKPGALGCSPDALVHLQRLTDKPADSSLDSSYAALEVRQRIRRSFGDLLDALAEEKTLLVIIDDVQNLDDVSRPLLAEQLAETSLRRVMWLLCSQKPLHFDGADTWPPHHELRLSGLGTAAITLLVASGLAAAHAADQSGLAEWCTSVSGGNPLFLNEFLRHWILTGQREVAPASLREIIRTRLGRIGRNALRVLQVCAALGNNASVGLVTSILGTSPADLFEAIEELENQGLLMGAAADAFAVHDVIALEALEAVTPALRAALHFEIGCALERSALTSWAPRVAWDAATHFSNAGESERAIRLLHECARHFLEIGLPEEAAGALREARSYARTTNARLELITAEILAMKHAGDWPRIQETLSSAREMIAATGERSSGIHELDLLQIETSWYLNGDIDATLATGMEFIRQSMAPTSQLTRAASMSMMLAENMCRADLMADIFSRVSDIRSHDIDSDVNALLVKAIYETIFGEMTKGADLLRQIVDRERKRGSIWALSRALRHWSTPLRRSGSYEESLERLFESLRLANEYGLVASAASASDAISGVYFELGVLDKSLEWVEKGFSSVQSTGERLISRSLDNQRLKLTAHTTLTLMKDDEVRQYESTVLTDRVVRRRNEDLAALIFWYVGRGDTARLQALSQLLYEGLQQSARLTGQDYPASALVVASTALGWNDRASAFSADYMGIWRREKKAPPWFLGTALSGCYGDLFGRSTTA